MRENETITELGFAFHLETVNDRGTERSRVTVRALRPTDGEKVTIKYPQHDMLQRDWPTREQAIGWIIGKSGFLADAGYQPA